LTWRDNSDNEDGFRVEIAINGRTTAFTVGANVTSFEIPSALRNQCGDQRFAVIAFNDAGESRPAAGIGEVLECPGVLVPFTSTPTPQQPTLPTSGSSTPDGRSVNALPYALAGLAGLFVTLAAVLRLRRR
jgi:hypothetical protein